MSQKSFIYVYDASSLTDGTNVTALLPLQQAERRFSLRRILGVSRVASALQLRRPGVDRPLFTSPLKTGEQLLITPSLTYDGNQSFSLDLQNISRSVTACGGFPIYNSVLGFQGALMDNAPETDVPGNAVAFRFTQALSVDWYRYVDLVSGVRNAVKTFRLQMTHGNFALTEIAISRSGSALNTDDFFIRLYDGDLNALSTAPVPANWYNTTSTTRSSLWPPVIYRDGSWITFDIESRICNLDVAMPKSYQITFGGLVWSAS